MTKSVKKMSLKLLKVKNRGLLYELYPYVWDMKGVISLLNSYVEWLGKTEQLCMYCQCASAGYLRPLLLISFF